MQHKPRILSREKRMLIKEYKNNWLKTTKSNVDIELKTKNIDNIAISPIVQIVEKKEYDFDKPKKELVSVWFYIERDIFNKNKLCFRSWANLKRGNADIRMNFYAENLTIY